MINRRFLLFAIALVLLPAATGCHDSAKIAPAMPAASPTPIPQAQKLAPPQVIEIKTFKVASPAAFSPDQLLGAGRVKFEVAGTAGQALLINVSTPVPQAGASSYSLSVQLQGNDSPEIPEAIPIRAGYCSGNYLYALPSTGTYQVLFDRAGVKHGIELTLLASDDPILNSGITPEQIDIDFGGLAKKTNLSVAPYSEIDGCGREVPSNMVVENDRFEFRVMQVAGYQELFKADRSMALLEAALRPGSKVASGQGLPYSYKEEWGAYIMSARPQLLEGEGWRGLRWIRGGGGDEDYPSIGLGYMFEGLSNDGRYFILIRADISHPNQKRFLPTRHINGTPPKTWESSDPQAETKMRLRLEKSLAAADPASFQPNLDQLDAVIRSLKLKQ